MNNKFTDDYKHFDNLIWQLPAWSTAVFVLAATGLAFISNTNLDELKIDVPKETMALGFLIICLVFQLSIFNALVRFRYHQYDAKQEDTGVFAKWRCSAQLCLQMVIALQSGALLFIVISIVCKSIALMLSIASVIFMYLYAVGSLYKASKRRTNNK